MSKTSKFVSVNTVTNEVRLKF